MPARIPTEALSVVRVYSFEQGSVCGIHRRSGIGKLRGTSIRQPHIVRLELDDVSVLLISGSARVR
jgi:hypothetical protein